MLAKRAGGGDYDFQVLDKVDAGIGGGSFQPSIVRFMQPSQWSFYDQRSSSSGMMMGE